MPDQEAVVNMVVVVGSMLAVELAFVLVVELDFQADSIGLLFLRFKRFFSI